MFICVIDLINTVPRSISRLKWKPAKVPACGVGWAEIPTKKAGQKSVRRGHPVRASTARCHTSESQGPSPTTRATQPAKQTQYNSLAAVCDLLRKLYPASESSFAVFVSIVTIAISCHQRLFSQRQNLLPWPLCIRFRDRRSWFVCVVFQLAEKRILPRKVIPCQLSDGLMLQCPDI
jgi:hypothetical protein